MNFKSLLIWTICVGFLCAGCIWLFEGLEDEMGQMADTFAQMGAFSTALGMDRISVATMEGYYATEIALMFAIGGAMFAAMTGAVIVSKEEEGHTSEFLNTLPFGKGYIIWWKYAAMAVLVLLFNVISVLWILAGFWGAGEMPGEKSFWLYHGAQFLMQLEVGSVCFLISAISKRKQIGPALGISILLYMVDLMCRIVPDIKNLKYITPYYFSNATDIFTESSVDGTMLAISVAVTAMCATCAIIIYKKRDLAS